MDDEKNRAEELAALAEQEGRELTDGELEQVSAGTWAPGKAGCPSCGSGNVEPQGMHSYKCKECGHVFKAG